MGLFQKKKNKKFASVHSKRYTLKTEYLVVPILLFGDENKNNLMIFDI